VKISSAVLLCVVAKYGDVGEYLAIK